jgi:prevent-host-death family protein
MRVKSKQASDRSSQRIDGIQTYVVTLLPIDERYGLTTKKLTSREFNQDTGRAKRAARSGPVYITDRGRPSHVLLTFEDYERLAGNQATIIELLSQPPGIDDTPLDIPASRAPAEPAHFD